MSKLTSLPPEKQHDLLLMSCRYQKNSLPLNASPFSETYDGSVKQFSKLIEKIKNNEELLILKQTEVFADWVQSVLDTNMYFQLGLDWVDQIILRGNSSTIFLITKSNVSIENTLYVDLTFIDVSIKRQQEIKPNWLSYLPAFILGAVSYYVYSKSSAIESAVESKLLSLGLLLKKKFT